MKRKKLKPVKARLCACGYNTMRLQDNCCSDCWVLFGIAMGDLGVSFDEFTGVPPAKRWQFVYDRLNQLILSGKFKSEKPADFLWTVLDDVKASRRERLKGKCGMPQVTVDPNFLN